LDQQPANTSLPATISANGPYNNGQFYYQDGLLYKIKDEHANYADVYADRLNATDKTKIFLEEYYDLVNDSGYGTSPRSV
jgi:hypothetical protein